MIRKIKPFVPSAVLKQLQYALIYSKFTYGIICYGSAYQNQIQRVINLTHRALKLILNRHTITVEICKSEHMFDFKMAHEYFCGINMYRILRLNNHHFLAAKVESYQRNHSHDTRSVRNQILTLPYYTRSKCQRSFLYIGLNLWNDIPLPIRNIHDDLKAYKKLLKEFLLS